MSGAIEGSTVSTANNSWHSLRVDETIALVESNASSGLLPEEARRRLLEFGPNALREVRAPSLLSVLLHQFKSPLIYLLLAAAGVALILGHVNDAIVIFVVLLLNTAIGTIQEGRAEHSLEALRKLATHKARVVRGGAHHIIDSHEVVPGDILLLEAGDAVAADARLLDDSALQIAEAALTGESIPVGKNRVPVAPDTPLADRRNMVYAGTHVTAGRARVIVVATGLATELGHIAALAERAKEPKTPLELRIAEFSRYIVVAALSLFVLVNLVGFLHGIPSSAILMISISQVVSMIPEGLPVAMTVALAIGVLRMARRNAVVRRLAAVETLGSTTVICTDKTGTLTKNEMTATAVYLPSGREITVTGTGYEPVGDFLVDAEPLDPNHDDELRELLEAMVLCNDAQLQGPDDREPRWRPIGDPTEVALLTLAIKGGCVPPEIRALHPRRAEVPFDSAAKMMATQHDGPRGPCVFIKGAPEVVLELSRSSVNDGETMPPSDNVYRRLRRAADGMAARALRVLALGVVDGGRIDGHLGFQAFRDRVRVLGLVGQIDPPRLEVKDAITRCRAAGIKPVMITGDHKATAHAIAMDLGITPSESTAIDGNELERMSDADLTRRIDAISVFARVHPAQKLRIVEALQLRHEVVAMTGDGVNDAPALVKADVGVAMGATGTEVAKEAAKMVLSDDNFATIVAAVEEGRVVYRNLKKLIVYLFTTSIAEVVILFTALLLGYPPPLVAVQILWINLVTDGMLTITLIMEPPEGDEMRQRPHPREEPILTRPMLVRVAFLVPAMAASTLGWFIYRQAVGVPFQHVQTETFTVLVVCQWFNVLNCRSERQSALNVSLIKNPWLVGGLIGANLLHAAVVFFRPLGQVFHTVSFDLSEVVAIGVVASLVLWVEEARKLMVRRREQRITATP